MSSDAYRKIVRRSMVRCLALLLLATGSRALADEAPFFDGTRAMYWLEAQCDLGPRTPGSAGNRQLRDLIVEQAEGAGLSVRVLCFPGPVPVRGDTVQICNIVVSAGPGGGDRLWLGAHFDTRPVCDRDPDPARRDEPLTGANDGASGTAVLLHLIEILGERAPTRGVDLLFFDGEDAGVSDRPNSYCIGSQHLAEHWSDFGGPLAEGRPRGLILLDMVGEAGLQIPQEQYSLQYAPAWTEYVFVRALELGLPAFELRRGAMVYDDHVPFLQQGIPAIDLIDFEYPQWHTVEDTPARCSAASLGQIGRLVTDLTYRP